MPPEGAYIQLSQRNAAMFWELGIACQVHHFSYCFSRGAVKDYVYLTLVFKQQVFLLSIMALAVSYHSASTYFCLFLSFLSPSILHSDHWHANIFGTSNGEEGASQWLHCWWNRNPSGCWQTHFSGFPFIPILSLASGAKALSDCAPRVWEHGNRWWQKSEARAVSSLGEVFSNY